MTASFDTLAAVDLGSNSFRLQIVRVMDGMLYPLDSLKDTVRLGGALLPSGELDQDIADRALACLARFGERLRGFHPDRVRVVGTNTLRVARDAALFIARAERLLGFPIEIIAGREEARLIYLGAAHSLPASQEKRLVVDIGGGSTEFIVGQGMRSLKTESLNLGCVSYSLRFFPDGRLTRHNFKDAVVAARDQIQRIAAEFGPDQWQLAIGTSGTARSLRDILEQSDFSSEGITLDGMEKLRAELIRAGSLKAAHLNGLRGDRAPVLPGGLSIMLAVFEELGIQRMDVTLGALRDGVLYDLLGRQDERDPRADSVAQMMRRYHVDTVQATRVARVAHHVLAGLSAGQEAAPDWKRELGWAAALHEIGLDISHTGYHKHSAYIVENADMPGFSRQEQKVLATLILAHRGSLGKLLSQVTDDSLWPVIVSLRLAALFSRSRRDLTLPENLHFSTVAPRQFRVVLDADWLDSHPMTASALREEASGWKDIGFQLTVRGQDDRKLLA